MKRAVLLGTGAFPPILRLWLEMFKKWQDEVDVAYIAVDHWISLEVKDYIFKLVKQFNKVKLIDIKVKDPTIRWPNSYNIAFKESKEDSFLIMHDDTFVYKKGLVWGLEPLAWYWNALVLGVLGMGARSCKEDGCCMLMEKEM